MANAKHVYKSQLKQQLFSKNISYYWSIVYIILSFNEQKLNQILKHSAEDNYCTLYCYQLVNIITQNIWTRYILNDKHDHDKWKSGNMDISTSGVSHHLADLLNDMLALCEYTYTSQYTVKLIIDRKLFLTWSAVWHYHIHSADYLCQSSILDRKLFLTWSAVWHYHNHSADHLCQSSILGTGRIKNWADFNGTCDSSLSID